MTNDHAPGGRGGRLADRWLSPLVAPWARYAVALAVLAALTLLQRLLRDLLAPAPFMGTYAAVVFAAWFCGVGPSIAVIAAGIAAGAYFFIEPLDDLSIAGPKHGFVVGGFALTSALIVILGARARAAFARLRELSEKLAASEEQWRSLAEAIPQIVWRADAGGTIDYQNGRWLELTGRSIDEARRLGWAQTVHPDDVPAVIARWREAVERGTVYEVESRLRRASDGSWRWHLSRAVPLRDTTGRIVRWFGTSTDIHDQKRAAEHARFLADAGEHLSSSLDYTSTLESVARAAIPYFADWASVDLAQPGGGIQRVAVAHADPAKVRLAQELFDKYPPRPDDPIGVPNVLRTGKPELHKEIPDELLVQVIPDPELLRIVRGLGLRSSITAPITARGVTLGALSFAMAESAREYAEADLAVAEELGRRAGIAIENARLFADAQAASRLKDEFLSTLSHELRTPLTAIVGWSQILRTTTDLERVRRGAEVIHRNAMAQSQLIGDLLDVSRIVTGKMRLNVRPVDPVQVIEAAVDAVRPSAEAKALRMETILDGRAGTISGDPDRVQQIVWNLLSNAVKFTPRSGRVEVRLSRVDSHVQIEISDTGIGIEPDFLPYVFERFTQANATASRTHGGLGLGMSIARHLTELHGGVIEARSAGKGRGATFVVRLPIAATTAPAPEPEEVKPAAHLPDPPQIGALSGADILVVEDVGDARDLIRDVLEHAGARVRTAPSAAEARAAIQARMPALLISDIGMPHEDGYTLIRGLRAGGIRIAAVALTAYARAEDRERALREGFDMHLSKPVEPAELIEVASALLRARG